MTSGAPFFYGQLFYGVLLLVVLVWCTIRPLMDPDIWLHMSFGRLLLDSGEFPTVDVFSHTAEGRPWMSSGWLASVLFELVFRVAGASGLVWFTAIVIGAAYGSIYLVSVRRGRDAGMVALLLIAAMLFSNLRFTPRPEIFSQLCLAVVLLVLSSGLVSDEAKATASCRTLKKLRVALWVLPFVFVVWSNLHAAFLVGLVPVGLAGVWLVVHGRGDMKSRVMLLAPLALCFVGWLANPYGYEIATLSGRIKSLANVRQIVNEWKPMFGADGLNQPPAAVMGYVGLVMIAIASMVWSRAWRWWEIVTAAIFATMPLYEIRHAGLSAIALASLTGLHLQNTPLMHVPRFVWPVIVGVCAIAVALMQFFGYLHFGRGWPSARLDDGLLPVTATKFMAANRPPDFLYNSYGPGGYLMYHLGERAGGAVGQECPTHEGVHGRSE